MAVQLKDFFSHALVENLAHSIKGAHPRFEHTGFVKEATRGLHHLELMARGAHISAALRKHLPNEYEEAVDILLRSIETAKAPSDSSMAPFFYLPHTMLIATHGLDDFEISMRAQHKLTQVFTCEFSIRPFLEKYPEKTLKVLARWSKDRNENVRRLVSEGTRPRLPWATRVRWIEREPERTLPLLETLKDDSSLYVRRSVANHLNDIYRAHPTLVHTIAERWLNGASKERLALVTHALRSAVKAGDPKALSLLGFGGKPHVKVEQVAFEPPRVSMGKSMRVSLTLRATSPRAQSLAVDLVVHFVKSNGKTRPKVFKLKTLTLPPGESAHLRKSISLAVHTTRKPYPGKHRVDLVINGEREPLGSFVVRD